MNCWVINISSKGTNTIISSSGPLTQRARVSSFSSNSTNSWMILRAYIYGETQDAASLLLLSSFTQLWRKRWVSRMNRVKALWLNAFCTTRNLCSGFTRQSTSWTRSWRDDLRIQSAPLATNSAKISSFSVSMNSRSSTLQTPWFWSVYLSHFRLTVWLWSWLQIDHPRTYI